MSRAAQYPCPGCPVWRVMDNFAESGRSGFDPTQSGYILFVTLIGREGRPGLIDETIDQGASTKEEIVASIGRTAWGSDSEMLHGQLTRTDIIESAVECKIRELSGDCTLVPIETAPHS